MQVWPAFWSLENVELVGRELEVGVGEDHERRVAAQLEARALAVLGAAPRQQPPGGHRARERELADLRSAREHLADRGGIAADEVQHAGRKPAASKISNSSTAESGVCSAGLSTTVLPAATAGASLRVTIELGKFQGVMQATTPRGRRRT